MDYCPWVALNDVFVSVNITGNTSWAPIVSDLARKGQESFAILTGRHGMLQGQMRRADSGPRLAAGHFPPRDGNDSAIDPTGDRETAQRIRIPDRNVSVEVVDVGTVSHNTIVKLRNEITRQLGHGRIVVLAWCFSLCAMKSGVDEALVPILNANQEGLDKENSKKVDEYVEKETEIGNAPISLIVRDWPWLEMHPPTAATRAALMEAVRA